MLTQPTRLAHGSAAPRNLFSRPTCNARIPSHSRPTPSPLPACRRGAPVSLEAQLATLEVHFRSLKGGKANGDPVFALEHPLSAESFGNLQASLGQMLRTHRRLSADHWLGWVVYAAEHGYRFNGQEFWDSFANATPGWTEYRYRDTLRDWFVQFHRQYNGVRPSGRWSDNYSYICWPVSHAIVPLDLQVQLAESMYNARYSLELASVIEPAALGALIARHTYAPTSRYEGFLQHAALAGRIVRALLQDDDAGGPIYRPTLERIATDISQIEHAREWMHEARTQYGRSLTRMRYGRPRPGGGAADQGGEPLVIEPQPAPPASLLPRLTVRAVASGRWIIDLAPPSLQAMCSSRPELRGHVERAGFQLAGFEDAQFPAAGLLLGQPHPRPLRRWPSPAQALIQVIPDQKELNTLLQEGCRLPSGPFFVFRLHDDGHGQLLSGSVVQPGANYLIAAADGARLTHLGVPAALDCDGLEAVLLRLPTPIPSALQALLQQASLSVRRTVSVTPVGLTPRRWSAAGEGEWLTTEHAAFVLEADHDLNHYLIRLDDSPAQSMPCFAGAPVQLLLPSLQVGEHLLSIRAYPAPPTVGDARPSAACEVRLSVRDPAPWTPGVLCDETFVVDLNPHAPSLDDLLSRRLDLHVEGDRSRKVDGYLVLEDAAGVEILRSCLFRHSLPVTNVLWARDLSKFLAQLGDDDQLLAASRGHLLFESDALGSLRVPLHIPARPVRWATQRRGPNQRLRLIEERSSADYSALHHAFAAPMRADPLEIDAMRTGIDVAGHGGLYTLEGEDGTQAVVVDQPGARATLDALRAAVDASALRRESDPAELLASFRLWRGARACSPSARLKQSQVARAIHQQLLHVLCGERWMHLEQAVRDHGANANWAPIEHAVGHEYNYAVQLTRFATLEQPHGKALAGRFEEVSRAYHMVTSSLSASEAWALAVDLDRLCPRSSVPWEAVKGPSRAATLVRGARLVQLCLDQNRSQL